MKPPTTVKRKKRGRPATGVDQLYGIRIPDNLILAIDRWAVDNDSSSRSDAIRRLLELGLSFSKKPPKAKH
jgi:metal-responsive CopG/Arc/MetJ family transcriptional regulator